MIAYVFPGQGSQFPGMAKEMFDSNPKARELMLKADSILGFSLTEVMFNGSPEDLKATRVTQPAVFLHSVVAALCAMDAPGNAPGSIPGSAPDSTPASGDSLPSPDMVAGHSLGEFSALAVAGVISFEDGLRLVSERALAMQACCEMVPGSMAAIIGLPSDVIEQICAEVPGTVVAANYNSDAQVVISGEKDSVAKACALLSEAGAKRALPLPVGGAFHSPLMAPAADRLSELIESTHFEAPLCPVYQNVTAQAETSPERIKANLLTQLTSPVRWTQSIKSMLADGAREFIEFGPGNVLQGLIRRIASSQEPPVTISGRS
ncbi:MAG: ACP S-malonyltransferase [Candidatus Cryptobacteroides sp.]|nr:ACP S-malonyltransferase [Candidatus Cryptobacteroides sp.]